MRVLIIGASGFVGRNVSEVLRSRHEVIEAGRDGSASVQVDLQDPKSIATALRAVRPDAVVSCVGIVENNDKASINVELTQNLLEQIVASKLPIKRIITLGSAAEYGVVDSVPVGEDTPKKPNSPYGRSKAEEVKLALKFRDKHHIPLVVARIFNPIGPGMHPRMIVPNVLGQIAACRAGLTDQIVVSRLDAERDYMDIKEVGRAIDILLEGNPQYAVYNIGSGVSTSNKRIVELLLAESGLAIKPQLVESLDKPESRAASPADITRIQKEFGWQPETTLEETIAGLYEPGKINTLIIGAGNAGKVIAQGIANNKTSAFKLVGFVDDDTSKHGKKINGIEVLGSIADLRSIVDATGTTEIIIAMPSRRGEAVRRVIQSAEGRRLVFRILPHSSDLLVQEFDKDYTKHIRRVEITDLVGGGIPKNDQQELKKRFKKEVVLITGAAGSIGSELSRQISLYADSKIIFFDWWENGMFDLRNQILENYPDGDYEFIVGSIRDKTRVDLVMRKYKPTSVFHAAAYKHVPLMEGNAAEAVKNNIVGTKILAESAVRHGVKKFVLVSTDKAVNPTNVMGATKRAAEKVIHILAESQSTTTFCAVRFGNVANSNGSVIPFFERHLAKGGPLPLTHKDITRFFMTIPEAVHLILKAWTMGENNDLFVLDMGESIKIYDLARWLIIINGYVPEKDIKIEVVGLRPGEKLYEEVLIQEEQTLSTPVEKIFRTKNYLSFDRLAFMTHLSFMIDALQEDQLNSVNIKLRLSKMISTYTPQGIPKKYLAKGK